LVDGQRELTSTAVNYQPPKHEDQTMTRILNDGRSFGVVKIYYDQDDLIDRCSHVGLSIDIRRTSTYFYYGIGTH
jgi:hypothetical protein